MKSAVAAIVILLLSLAGTAACLTLIAMTPHERIPIGLRLEDVARFLPMQTSFTVVGALIVWRRPRNRIGWFLSAGAVLSAAQLFAAGYAVYGVFGDAELPRPEIAAWIFVWLDSSVALALALIGLTFPDGRLRSRTAGAGVALGLLGTFLGLGFLALRPGPLFNIEFVDNPFGVALVAEWQTPLLALIVLVLLGANVFIVSSIRERLRDSTSVERQQMKWMVGAVGLTVASITIGFPFIFIDWESTKTVWAATLCLIPLSIGIAILRYRLYDIDVLINRTLVYGLTTAAIAITFFGGIVVLQTPLRALTGGSELAVAISTLASFALFQPLRARIQTGVDRRFYRARYDAARTLDEFSGRLRDEVDLDAVRSDLLSAVRDTMRPAHASVWLREARR
jgi:hypothetical protein